MYQPKPKIAKYVLLGLLAVVTGIVIWQFVLLMLPTTFEKETDMTYKPGMSIHVSRLEETGPYGLTLEGEAECRELLDAMAPMGIYAASQAANMDTAWAIAFIDGKTAAPICYVTEDGKISMNALIYTAEKDGAFTGLLNQIWEKYSHKKSPIEMPVPSQTPSNSP